MLSTLSIIYVWNLNDLHNAYEQITHIFLTYPPREFPDNDTAVEFKDATLSWDVAMDAPTILRDVSLKIPRSKLTIVVGEVGSGKTAIINAVLHEMHVQSVRHFHTLICQTY